LNSDFPIADGRGKNRFRSTSDQRGHRQQNRGGQRKRLVEFHENLSPLPLVKIPNI
jgi:hypothetical protein